MNNPKENHRGYSILARENRPYLSRFIPRKKKEWAIAIICVVVLGSVLILQSGRTPHKAIFHAYFEPFPYPGTLLESAPLSVGYVNGQYDAVIEGLLPSSELARPGYEELVLGCSYLALGQEEEAIRWFTSLSTSTSEELKYHGNWYLALSHLKLGEVSKAKLLLQRISNTDSPWQEKALMLLKEL